MINNEKKTLITIRKTLQEELEMIAKEKKMTLNQLANQSFYDNKNIKIAKEISNEYKNRAIKKENIITNDIKNLQTKYSKLINSKSYIKSDESLIRKIIIKDKVNKIYDIIRYTIIINEDNYMNEVENYLNKLSNIGYEIINDRFKNYWGNKIYQGINVCLLTPYNIEIEIQFHTKDSYITKQYLNHIYYEIYRNPLSSSYEKELSKEIMMINQSLINIPKDILEYKYNKNKKLILKK